MTWQSERREDARLRSEQAREDVRLAGEQKLEMARLAAEQTRENVRLAAEQAAQAKADRKAERDKRGAKWSARWVAVRMWAKAHPVDLLIYPLAVASAVGAVPSMAAYGAQVMRGNTGMVLPILSELGMWAFAVAVTVSRTRFPDRPVWALQLGVWLFAGIALGLNVLHGSTGPGGSWDAGVVMGVVSIAGVIAHQLATASPRRSRAERAALRIRRRSEDKLAKAQLAAIRAAVAQIGPGGEAELIYAPGRFALTRRGRLDRVILPGLPVDPVDPIGDTLAAEVTAWLETYTPDSDPTPTTPADPDDEPTGGGVATLDPPEDPTPDLHRSTPRRPRKPSIPNPSTRTEAELTDEFHRLLDHRPDGFDPTSAESIRKTLRCSIGRARKLRDRYRADAD